MVLLRYFVQLICECRLWIKGNNNVGKATIMFRHRITNNSNRYMQEKYTNLKVFAHFPWFEKASLRAPRL